MLNKSPTTQPTSRSGQRCGLKSTIGRGLAAAAGAKPRALSIDDVTSPDRDFQSTLPAKFRDLFAARPDISDDFVTSRVRSHQ